MSRLTFLYHISASTFLSSRRIAVAAATTRA